MSVITDILDSSITTSILFDLNRESATVKIYGLPEAEQKLKAYFLGLLPSDKSPYYDQGKYTGEEDPFSSSGAGHFNTGYNYALKQLRERINEG